MSGIDNFYWQINTEEIEWDNGNVLDNTLNQLLDLVDVAVVDYRNMKPQRETSNEYLLKFQENAYLQIVLEKNNLPKDLASQKNTRVVSVSFVDIDQEFARMREVLVRYNLLDSFDRYEEIKDLYMLDRIERF